MRRGVGHGPGPKPGSCSGKKIMVYLFIYFLKQIHFKLQRNLEERSRGCEAKLECGRAAGAAEPLWPQPGHREQPARTAAQPGQRGPAGLLHLALCLVVHY